jgi:UDP-glucose 4-epimerase
MRIIIFGGGGFLGSTICDRLLQGGHELRVFERPRVSPYRAFLRNEKLEWITGDFTSRHDIEKALEGMEAVIHLVSTTLPKNSNDDTIYDVQSNIVATLQVLEEMKKNGIRKIIFISSGGTVYGVPQSIPISENHPTEPICSYGITKLAIEKYLNLYKKLAGIQPVVLRLSNPYGPRQRIETAQGAIAAFLHTTLTSRPIQIWGDGSVVRDYIFIEDVAAAFSAALDYQGDETIFNIGSGTGVSLNQLIKKIEGFYGPNLKVEYQAGRAFDVPTNILCINKAARHLGWSPRTDLQTGLSKTREWILAEFQAKEAAGVSH